MMKKYFLWIFFALFSVACTNPAKENLELSPWLSSGTSSENSLRNSPPDNSPEERILNLSKMIEVTLENNPKIKSSRYHWQGVIEKYPQVVTLPDPNVMYSYFLENTETRVGPQKHAVKFTQKIPFPSKLFLRGKIVKKEAQVAHLGYERVIRDVIAEVQKSFYELLYIERALEITKKNEDLLGHLTKVSAVEHSEEKTILADVMKAQSQLSQLGYDHIRLEELRRVEVGQLNALMDRAQSASLQIKDFSYPARQNLPDFPAIHQFALQKNQEVLASQVEIDKADTRLSLAFQEYFPDLYVGFNWVQIDRNIGNLNFSDDGQDTFALTFGIDVPLWLGKRNARVRESRFEIKRAQSFKKDLENQLAAKIKKIYYKASNARRLVELYQKNLIPQARRTMEISENWYRDGKGNLLGVLETQSVWLNFSLSLARAQSDYAQGLVELARLSGGDLPYDSQNRSQNGSQNRSQNGSQTLEGEKQ